jgi:hypothetical protein
LLPGIKSFAFGQIALNIDQNDLVADVFVCQYVGTGGAYVAGTNDGNFTHVSGKIFGWVF